MTADIRTAALAQARTREAHIELSLQHWTRVFVEGAMWGAARVTPTREQIAHELGRHWYDANTEMCDCGWDQPTAKDTSYDNHLADAIMALMQELSTKEDHAEH